MWTLKSSLKSKTTGKCSSSSIPLLVADVEVVVVAVVSVVVVVVVAREKTRMNAHTDDLDRKWRLYLCYSDKYPRA